MTSERPGLGPVLLTVLLDLLGFGLVIPLLSFYAETFGATALQVTALMASYSVAQFLCAPAWGSLSDRIGRRPVMLISVAGTVVALAAFASSSALWMLFLCRTLHGMFAANIGAAQAYVADVTAPEDRARGMGLIGASFGIGFTLGPVVGGGLYYLSGDLTVPIWFAAGLSAVNLLWALLRLPESRRPDSAPARRRTLDPRVLFRTLAHPVVGMVVLLAFTQTFAFSMLEATFALVAEHVWSMTAGTVGGLFGGIGIVGIVVQGGLIGRLAKRFGEATLLLVGYVFTATGMGLLAATAPDRLWLLDGWAGIVGGCACIAVGTSLSNPSLMSLVSRGTAADEQGSVLGVSQSLSALARALAPVTGGALYSGWFRGGAFAAASLMMLASLLIAVPAVRRATALR